MKLNAATSQTNDSGPIIALSKVAEQMGRSSVTLWRWRREGWLKTINISGRPYVTAEALAEFTERAAAGEFAKQPFTPNRARSLHDEAA
jgi:transposase-like protein